MKGNEMRESIVPDDRRKIIKTLGIGIVGVMISRVLANPFFKLSNHSRVKSTIRISVNKSAVKRVKKVTKNV